MTTGEADYQIAIDDSGGIEALVTRSGEFFPGDHPFANCTAVMLRTELMGRLEHEWTALRRDIQAATGAATLPPIHMRIMTGKSRPPKYRGQPNPYFGVDIEQIKEWAERGVQIAVGLNRVPRGLDTFRLTLKRAQEAKPILAMHANPSFQAESAFIKRHSVRPFPKLYQRYHLKSASILVPTLKRVFAFADEVLRQAGQKTGHFLLDPFDDSSGLDSAEAYEVLTSYTNLAQIQGVSRVPDSDQSALIQLADLMGYLFFRVDLAESREEPIDRFTKYLLTTYWEKLGKSFSTLSVPTSRIS